ncbi:CCA tRNA nucleotidyltransferase [Poseidonocella sedimentorum]|uniref:Poly(A) polymerase n=1 Tax=Poseidonocella sedimentorum TaxID=871652 RepID=A0A1I6D5T0_9RHOB|nr:CCA tRNA nucleotidyltransferase [Poseidonocella sedimentorum]SFR00825.1 poly(A) polymerase [Poseidonocella sedimentorum]
MKVTGAWIEGKTTQAVMAMLAEAGHQAFVVGGCVRNALLGAPITDIDISTDARPERVLELAGKAGFKAVPTGIDHGTVTVIAGGIPHEITTFRRDVETDGRRAVVAYANSIEDDAHRRDFTMNALYASADGAIHDPINGLPDLRARRLRFIDDPRARITEDYLRILRFFRFHAWYGDPDLGLDAEGLAACAELSEGLEQISRERLGGELMKLLSAPDPAPSVAAMAHAGVLGRILPGADARPLPILIHEEAQRGVSPDALRRLATLTSPDAEALRLSRQQARRAGFLARAAREGAALAPLALDHGADTARDVLLIRAALLETPVSDGDWRFAQTAAAQDFPVAATDLMPDYTGPALGARLAALRSAWIASGFTLTRAELLDLPRE